MNTEKTKTVVIFVLIAVVIALGAYSLFGRDGLKNIGTTKEFVEDIQNLQSSMSYYLGSTYSDTFGVYTKTEILSGKATNKDGEQINIKDNEDKNLPTLVNTEEKIEVDNKALYKMSNDDIKTVFELDFTKYGDISLYVGEDGIIKVDFEKEPNWWRKEFEVIKVNK